MDDLAPGVELALNAGEEAWRNAWRHELRGRGGRWVRGTGLIGSVDHDHQAIMDRIAEVQKGVAGVAESRALDQAYSAVQDGNKAKAIMSLQKAMAYATRLGAQDRVKAYYQAEKDIDALPDLPRPQPRVADSVDWLLKDAASHSRLAEASSLLDAKNAVNGGHPETAAQALLNAALTAERDTEGGRSRAEQYRALANQISPGAVLPVPPEIQAVKGFLDKVSGIVPGLFGEGNALGWDGKEPGEFKQTSRPSLLADTDWVGHMRFSDEVARDIQDALSGDGPVKNPDALTVPLHEDIHTVLPAGSFTPGEERRVDMSAYQDPVVQSIEEGFTQLGTAQHAEEFFQKAGLADRKTLILSPADIESQEWKDARMAGVRGLAIASDHLYGLKPSANRTAALDAIEKASHELGYRDSPYEMDDAVLTLGKLLKDNSLWAGEAGRTAMKQLKDDVARIRERQFKLLSISSGEHETMGQYARRMADPALIASGNSWGHYGQWTKDAQEFTQTIARLMGDNNSAVTQGLADQVNSVGPARKLRVMAEQTMRAAGVSTGLTDDQREHVLQETMATIASAWRVGPQEAVSRAVSHAKAQIQAMQEAA